MQKQTISVLGSTGSIGTQALEVAKKIGNQVYALSAHTNIELLEKQAREFLPRYVVITEENAYRTAKIALGDTDIKVLYGMEGLCEIASDTANHMILNALVGMVGLQPTLCALEAGIAVALANKETLVAGGQLVMDTAHKNAVPILPVDSEHSAIFQCLQGNMHNKIDKILLTASGGPFFGKTKKELETVTVKDALAHPNWSMGAKITVDSATLMNKGLEFIEAIWLFDVTPAQIEVIVHRESVIHSAVQYADGSVLAQLGVPDMKIPIQYALTYPNRLDCDVKRLSLTDYGKLTFQKPDPDTFSCLPLAIEAIGQGGLAPCILNGANEAAVALFLEGRIRFLQIAELIAETVQHIKAKDSYSLQDVLEADKAARQYVFGKVK